MGKTFQKRLGLGRGCTRETDDKVGNIHAVLTVYLASSWLLLTLSFSRLSSLAQLLRASKCQRDPTSPSVEPTWLRKRTQFPIPPSSRYVRTKFRMRGVKIIRHVLFWGTSCYLSMCLRNEGRSICVSLDEHRLDRSNPKQADGSFLKWSHSVLQTNKRCVTCFDWTFPLSMVIPGSPQSLAVSKLIQTDICGALKVTP